MNTAITGSDMDATQATIQAQPYYLSAEQVYVVEDTTTSRLLATDPMSGIDGWTQESALANTYPTLSEAEFAASEWASR